MLVAPAGPAVVLEAGQVATEVGPVAESANVAEDVVKVGIDLNLTENKVNR
jgi:hypothetical protein